MERVGLVRLLAVGILVSIPTCQDAWPSPQVAHNNDNDWLLRQGSYQAKVSVSSDGKEAVLSNGLIRRVIRLRPNAATVEFENLMMGESIIRAVKPEAMVEIDGERYEVGGLKGQAEYAYLLPQRLDELSSDPAAFQFKGLETGKTKMRFEWKRKRYSPDAPWPPPGVSLRLDFVPPEGKLAGVAVSVHYELYDNIPLLCKWITVGNSSQGVIRLNTFTSEILAVVEDESNVGDVDYWEHYKLHVESDYAFGGMDKGASKTTYWVADPRYTSQVNYSLRMLCVLEVRPPIGPDVGIEPGGRFESFRTFELVFDSTERERRGLAVRRMYRTIAPWAGENPIFMHLTDSRSEAVRRAVDQCAEVGFEMVILSFGSGLDMENEDAAYIEKMKGLVDYAHSKGVELGGYSLLASRRISDEHDVINPATGKTGGAIFGNSPCLASRWGQEYFRKLAGFFEKTGFDMLEHDGSYPGDVCASTAHPGHKGLKDSQWRQWTMITDFYKWCRGKGIFLNVPDWYFLNGSNKTGMGYRETNWSLPRERQIILGRQNIYDGTWLKTPSMGWMFVPLVQYHGGGAAATLEPLCEHLEAYEAHLAQNFGAGVQACYRGPRLYDTDETRSLVKKWVDFYKKYRAILDSDIIHVRRADGRHLDCILHVNSNLKHKALAMVYNPIDRSVKDALVLPLYYTGLTEIAKVRQQYRPAKSYKLDRRYGVEIAVEMGPNSFTWFVVE